MGLFSGSQTMAKRQKNAFLDEDLCRAVERVQQTTGVAFPRLATAALLKYLLGALEPINLRNIRLPNYWMVLAGKIEDGELSIENAPDWLMETGLQVLYEAITFLKECEKKPEYLREAQHRLTIAIEVKGRMKGNLMGWKKLKSEHKNAMDALLTVFDRGGFLRASDFHAEFPADVIEAELQILLREMVPKKKK